MTNKILSKVCIVTDSLKFTNIQKKEIENMVGESNVEIPLILVDESESNPARNEFNYSYGTDIFKRLIKSIRSQGIYTLVHIEAVLYDLFSGEKSVRTRYLAEQRQIHQAKEIPELNDAKIIKFSSIPEGGQTYSFPRDVIEKINSISDVVILFDYSKILRGDILTSPEYGVWVVHPSDIQKYRGRPVGLWEFLNDESEIGVTLQRINEELDGGEIIYLVHSDITNTNTLYGVKMQAEKARGSIISNGIKNMRKEGFSPTKLNKEQLGELSFEKEKYKYKNVFRIIVKNVIGRYLNKK